MALDTVTDYVREARVLLQDQVETYRYSNAELLQALNMGILTARRLRPDLFIGVAAADLPEYDTVDSTAVDIDVQYRTAFLYFMVGHAQMRDEEDTQDQRAAAFIGKFTQQLMVLV